MYKLEVSTTLSAKQIKYVFLHEQVSVTDALKWDVCVFA